ncbi:MAG TPA: ribosome biogenesis GTPase Der [Bacillota bacterium]|nr:ribosome biogenesis GTPase Der [Bacillota bacterium]HOL09836.1 ribosome biogenesis GTPase Der [Bacillota bacterium]HPO97713.1 ribosome biogenesis GTPase Der [Bacillota bacterium]
MPKAIVAIVGRPNVGKSTLFNRIARQRLAIVEDTPGVTRDRLYTSAVWLDREFVLIDTGGITDENDTIQVQIRKQVEIALEEADAIIMVVDGRQPLTTSDHQVADLLRRTNKPVVLAVNKIEDVNQVIDYDVYTLGLGEPILISAEHAKNIGDLLDAVMSKIPQQTEAELEDVIRVTFVGRPNVGKSSLVNAMLGKERVIVSDIPGTTRDAIDTPVTIDGTNYLLVDTAGIRRKSKVEEAVEYYSVLRAMRAVERSDVVILVIDATQNVAEQDLKIASIIQEAGKACIILINKWDLVVKDSKTVDVFTEKIRDELEFIDYAPILFVSAKTGQRLQKLPALINQVMENYLFRVSTNRLNEIIADAMMLHQPPAYRGKPFKIYYSTQIKVKPPTFSLTVSDPEGMQPSYQRYLENKLREYFGFQGTPIKFYLKTNKK